jgi:hypothetical protein
MAGNAGVLNRVHTHFADRLKYSMTVGLSHHDATPQAPPTSGPEPVLFFAPSQVEKRVKDWGVARYQNELSEALHTFVETSRSWLNISRSTGPQAAAATWAQVRSGKVPPDVGRIVTL